MVKEKKKKNRKQQRLRREPEEASRAGEELTTNPRLRALILEVVEGQVRDNDPPETRQTLERLLAAGYPRKQAVERIGSALVEEIWAMLHERKPFDRARFAALLDQVH